MQSVFDHADILHQPVSDVMGRPFPALEQFEEIERAYKLLTLANPAIVVTDDGEPIGVLTRQDIITFLSTSSEVVRGREVKFATKAIHVGQDADPATGATIVPIYQTSTYTQDARRRAQRLRLQPDDQSDASCARATTRLARRRALCQRVCQRNGGDDCRTRTAFGGRPRRRQRRSLWRHVSALCARPRTLRTELHLRRHDRA